MYAIAEQLDHAIQLRYNRWKRAAELPSYLRKELEELKAGEITDRFYKHLDFGTDGIREKVGVGTNRMNIFTVRRIAMALAEELKASGFSAGQRGVAIAFDNRLLSRAFAEQAAFVLSRNDIKVYLFEQAIPTPELSFAIRLLHAAAGIMITAGSHPYNYNGCKLFTDTGSVMPLESTKRLSRRLLAMEDEVGIDIMDGQDAVHMGRLVMIGKEVAEAYQRSLESIVSDEREHKLIASNLHAVFTPLHGISGETMATLFRRTGYKNVHMVEEQFAPDPLFPTLSCPDPQDPGSIAHALRAATRHDADIVMAADPESQELGVSVKCNKGKYRQLTPNQLGSLLLDYRCEQRKARCEQRKAYLNEQQQPGIFIKSVLTTELSAAIAVKHGLKVMNALPGFSNIAARITEQEQQGEQPFFFAFDESGGYLPSDFVRDKDALQAALLTAEMAAYYKAKNQTLWDRLQKLYQIYGFYLEDQISLTFTGIEGWQRVRNVMERLHAESPKLFGSLVVRRIFDYRAGKIRWMRKGRNQSATGQPKANIIKYLFDEGSWCAVRPSGSEPVLKLYYGCKDATEEGCKRKLARIRSALLYYVESII
ncbi:phospho-sugar mutase [Paenibacillus tarimensis]